MQQQGLSTELIKNSSRAITIKDVWNSTEISFKKMETSVCKETAKSIIVIEVAKMVSILKADMQDIHIEYMADYILKHYYSYTISDITCLTDRLVKNNPYGKPILQNLIHELDNYSTQKQEYAVHQRQKESGELKADTYSNDEMAKVYFNLKEEKYKKKSRKEKDMIAQLENQERIEEMKLLYPDHG